MLYHIWYANATGGRGRPAARWSSLGSTTGRQQESGRRNPIRRRLGNPPDVPRRLELKPNPPHLHRHRFYIGRADDMTNGDRFTRPVIEPNPTVAMMETTTNISQT